MKKIKLDFKKQILPIAVVGLLVTTSFFIGVFFGNRGFSELGPISFAPKSELINRDSGKPENVDFSLFWEAYNKLNEEYLGEINQEDLLYGAIKGMAEATGDPYTVYMTPTEANEFMKEIEGIFSGVGIEVGIRNETLVVISPLDGTPADEAGVRARDEIIKINDEETFDMSLDEAVGKIRGEEGTKVKLTVRRGDEIKEVEMTRKKINIDSVTLSYQKYKGSEIAILKISQFTEETPNELSEAVDKIVLRNPKGIVLDLRGNPGGYLESAVDMASEFLDEGVVVIEESSEKKENFETTRKGKLLNKKMIVLIDEGSASASEIVAGALKDRGRAQLVGMTSFGKGSVQIVFDLSKGILKVTTSKWLTPKGISISEVGIKPDVEVEMSDEDLNNFKDPQLNKALELIGG
jgi:carboxyl-terminal processing protease